MEVEVTNPLAAAKLQFESGLLAYKAAVEQQEAKLAAERNALALERTAFEEEKKAIQKLHPSSSSSSPNGGDLVTFNVGGKEYTTVRSVLTDVEPNSVLASMFSGRWDAGLRLDEKGRPFLDFDPALFDLLLNHLRMKHRLGPHSEEPAPSLPTPPSETLLAWEEMLDYLGFKKPEVCKDTLQVESPGGARDALVSENGTKVIGKDRDGAMAGGVFASEPGSRTVWKLQVLGRDGKGERFIGVQRDEGYAAAGFGGDGTESQEHLNGEILEVKAKHCGYKENDIVYLTLDTTKWHGTLTIAVPRTGWQKTVKGFYSDETYRLYADLAKGQGFRVLHE
eukprot:GDKI01015459.1.p1 GENE.GDKI01015459.1~~GDKI01015459.1.p1  ORF type:complete len:348 (-),score=86.49 GDKI01015459.1:74-1084(-)